MKHCIRNKIYDHPMSAKANVVHDATESILREGIYSLTLLDRDLEDNSAST